MQAFAMNVSKIELYLLMVGIYMRFLIQQFQVSQKSKVRVLLVPLALQNNGKTRESVGILKKAIVTIDEEDKKEQDDGTNKKSAAEGGRAVLSCK